MPWVEEHVIQSRCVVSAGKTKQKLQIMTKNMMALGKGGLVAALQDMKSKKFHHDSMSLVLKNPNYTFLGTGSNLPSLKLKELHSIDWITTGLEFCAAPNMGVGVEEYRVMMANADSLQPYTPLFCKVPQAATLPTVPCYLSHIMVRYQYVGMARCPSTDVFAQIQALSRERYQEMVGTTHTASIPSPLPPHLMPVVVVEVTHPRPPLKEKRVECIRPDKMEGNSIGTVVSSMDANSNPVSLHHLCDRVAQFDEPQAQQARQLLLTLFPDVSTSPPPFPPTPLS